DRIIEADMQDRPAAAFGVGQRMVRPAGPPRQPQDEPGDEILRADLRQQLALKEGDESQIGGGLGEEPVVPQMRGTAQRGDVMLDMLDVDGGEAPGALDPALPQLCRDAGPDWRRSEQPPCRRLVLAFIADTQMNVARADLRPDDLEMLRQRRLVDCL